MAQVVEDWYKQMPVITRSYLTAAILTTVGCSLDVKKVAVDIVQGLTGSKEGLQSLANHSDTLLPLLLHLLGNKKGFAKRLCESVAERKGEEKSSAEGEARDNLQYEGVLYAKKDFNMPKHPEIDVPNLQVIKLMQSFKSKEYVRESFAWMHYYWYLTNDGIEYLRTYLNLPSEIVPATLKKSAKPLGRPMGGPPGGDRPRGPPRFDGDRPRFGDREGYRGGPPRGGPGEFGDKGGAPPEYQPSFRGPGARPGFGRGGGGYGAGSASLGLQE